MLFDLSFTTNYSELKNKASDLNVDCENTERIKYDYKVNDLSLLDCGTFQRKLVAKRDGPYQVIRVYSNGTLKFVKASTYSECEYVGALLILIAPMKEAKCYDLASMRTTCVVAKEENQDPRLDSQD
jgi:hypothetical protein